MDTKKPVEITVTNKTIIRIILIVVGTFLAVRFILNVSHVLTLIFVSFFLAMALNPAVRIIRKQLRINSRAGATGIAYITVLILIIGFFAVIIPPLVSQTGNFVTTFPTTVRNLKTQDSAIGRLVQRNQLEDNLDAIASELGSKVKLLPQPVFSTASRVGATIASILAVLVMTFMMIVEGPYWAERFWAIQTKKRREHWQPLVYKMYNVITGYVVGQLLISLIAALFALIAMLVASTLLGVSINAVGLAGVVALTGLIPMIGNTIGAVLVVFVCMLTSIPLAIIMGIFFLLYQQIENITIQPHIQSRKNELTPLLVFIAALLGIGFGGILGAFVAIPIAGCIKVLVNDYYRRRSVTS
jgi:predicted PurR-regulated permease PerM